MTIRSVLVEFVYPNKPSMTHIGSKGLDLWIHTARDERDDGANLTRFENIAAGILDREGIRFVHDYSWPGDGNFYWNVEIQEGYHPLTEEADMFLFLRSLNGFDKTTVYPYRWFVRSIEYGEDQKRLETIDMIFRRKYKSAAAG